MGFYIRKAFSFGPLRLNLSRSGLGASFGVPGARIGIGPHGSYIQMGRGGLYYRQTLHSARPIPEPLSLESIIIGDLMEARVGIEPTYKGFADLSLTTWVPRPGMKYSESWASFQPGKPLPRPFRSESTCLRPIRHQSWCWRPGLPERRNSDLPAKRVSVGLSWASPFFVLFFLFYVEFVGEAGLHRLHQSQDVTQSGFQGFRLAHLLFLLLEELLEECFFFGEADDAYGIVRGNVRELLGYFYGAIGAA